MMDVVNAPIFSPKTYNTLKRLYVYPAVRQKYQTMNDLVTKELEKQIKEEGPVNIVGDGSFDSRGHSAFFCRYYLLDAKTKLVVGYTIVRQKPNGEIQASAAVTLPTSASSEDDIDSIWDSMEVVTEEDDDSDAMSTESMEDRSVDALWDALELVSDSEIDDEKEEEDDNFFGIST
ncbi:unnamed protein product [Caenorhabditis brenneri]